MAIPEVSLRQLLDAGVHFGHHPRRWNPKMKPYIYGARNGVHIVDLQQTVPMLTQALTVLRDIVAKGGRVLFVGTKRQASDMVAEAAKLCGQYYVNHRWLGGTLTNWRTITDSIRRLKEIEAKLNDPSMPIIKKERLLLSRERDKLEVALGGIREMGGVPDAMIVIDTMKEDIAIKEAKRCGIPVIAVVDTNVDPDLIDYPIPGNDDASRAIALYCQLFAAAILDGLQQELLNSGEDLGASDQPSAEPALADVAAVESELAQAANA